MTRTTLKKLALAAGLTCGAMQVDAFELAGFESGNPYGSGVTVSIVYGSLSLETGAAFIDPVMPTQGAQFGYITTGPGGIGPATYVDVSGNGTPELDISMVRMEFTLTAPTVLSFDYDVMTEEITGGQFDPYGILLDGMQLAGGAVGGTNGNYAAQTGFNNIEVIGPNDEQYIDGRFGWQSVNLFVPSGAHVFEFFVADAGDDIGDTALLIDNVQANPAPIAPSWLLMLTGLGLLRRRRA